MISCSSRPDFGENVRGGGKIFRGGVTMISSSRQRVKIKQVKTFIQLCLHIALFLSSMFNCLIKFMSLIILLGEVLVVQVPDGSKEFFNEDI